MAISLDSIRKTGDIKPPRVLIYSTHGIGKTTLAANAPKPIFIQTEDGEGSLTFDTFTPDGVVGSYDEVIECFSVLYNEEHDYKTVVIDSLDHLEPLVWQKVCQVNGWDSIETPGYGKGYVEADVYWRQILQWLNALRTQKGMVVLLTAHAKIEKFESPEHDAFDRFDIKLHKRANGLVQELVDVILFANQKMHVVKEDGGFNKKRSRGVSTGERVMYTVEAPAFVAKNRYGLPPELPLDWPTFEQALIAARAQPEQSAEPATAAG
jgi:hypothetical protein